MEYRLFIKYKKGKILQNEKWIRLYGVSLDTEKSTGTVSAIKDHKIIYEILPSCIVFHADGISVHGTEVYAGTIYYQEWWLTTLTLDRESKNTLNKFR